jgi:hypothetical protein
MPLDDYSKPAPRSPSPQSKLDAGIVALRRKLGSLAEVLSPNASDEPILAPNIRLSVYQWLHEIRAEKEFERAKVKPRRTALLVGPAGCGKTTLAHHLAARLGIPLVVVGAETLLDAYHGASERNMGQLFAALEEASVPAILFMDELEAIGGKRDHNTRGGADNARTSTLSVLLRKIESFKGYAIAATNKEDFIDPALWRRFNIHMTVDLPGYDERYAILDRYRDPFVMAPEALAVIADLTDGASPALLRGLMEGMKRGLILNPKMSLPIDTPEQVFVPIISSLKPPPEMPDIALWRNPTAIHAIAECGWPPEMPNE